MSKSPKNLFVREVEPNRKSCPHCGTDKRTLVDQRIFALGEYIRCKWHNVIDRFCESCFDCFIPLVVKFCRETGRTVSFNSRGGPMPWFLSHPLIFADRLEETDRPESAKDYRNMANYVEV